MPCTIKAFTFQFKKKKKKPLANELRQETGGKSWGGGEGGKHKGDSLGQRKRRLQENKELYY